MLRDFVWSVFENTGDIHNYMFYRELEGVKEVNDKEIKKDSNNDLMN